MKLLRSFFFTLLIALSAPFVLAEPVDINQADAATLAANLKGVGPQKAQAIVEYREKHGMFKSLEELSQVKGIGEKLVAQNKDNIIIRDTGAAQPSGTLPQKKQ